MKFFELNLVNYDENNVPYNVGTVHCSAARQMSKEEATEFCRDTLEMDFEEVFNVEEISLDEVLEYMSESVIPVFDVTQSLSERIASAEQQKEAATESKIFDVTITETLKMTVQVEADSLEEAKQIVSDNYHRSEYILDADHFKGVEFEAKEAMIKNKTFEGAER